MTDYQKRERLRLARLALKEAADFLPACQAVLRLYPLLAEDLETDGVIFWAETAVQVRQAARIYCAAPCDCLAIERLRQAGLHWLAEALEAGAGQHWQYLTWW